LDDDNRPKRKRNARRKARADAAKIAQNQGQRPGQAMRQVQEITLGDSAQDILEPRRWYSAAHACADANTMSHVVGTEDLLKASLQATDLTIYKAATAGAIIATAADARQHTYEATQPLSEQIGELCEDDKVQNSKLALLYKTIGEQDAKIGKQDVRPADLEARIAAQEAKFAQLLVSAYGRTDLV
jgi:hypothetical protein